MAKPVAGRAGSRGSSPRLRNSDARQRARLVASVVVLLLGLASVVTGIIGSRVAPPSPVALDANGTTAVPQTHFFQNPWVLFGQVDDPRRAPTPSEVGCEPEGDLRLGERPDDITAYGSRVVDGVSVSAIGVFSRSGDRAAIRCTSASGNAPLWLFPSSDAAAFTATGIAILGALLLVLGSLLLPLSFDRLPRRRRHDPAR